MRNIYILTLSIFIHLNAQTPPDLNWSLNPKNGPTSGSFTVSEVIFDKVSSEFNSLPITIGNFSSTGNFIFGNDAALDFFEEAIGENLNTFIAKHDENDEVLWVKKLYGDGGFIPTAAIAVGNFFYVVGELNGTIDFNPASGTANRTSISEKNLVIAKYDLNGFYVNSKLIGGSGLVSAHKIVNNGSKLAIIGELEGTVDFDPNSGVYNISSSGEKDGYVSVFSTNLAHQWTQQYGDIGTDAIKDVAIDGNSVLATATVQSTGIECGPYPDPNSFLGEYILTITDPGILESVTFGDSATIDVVALNNALGGTLSDWGLVGSATDNGWGGPDMKLYETSVNIYELYANLSDEEMKFRFNDNWAQEYGDDGADGSLNSGGANIVIPQYGVYHIKMDLNTNLYTIERVFSSETITLSDSGNNSRSFIPSSIYPDLGAFNAPQVTIDFDSCGTLSIEDTNTNIGCVSNTFIGTADLINTYDQTNDNSFSIQFYDDIYSDCGVQELAKMTFTKIGAPIISQTSPTDPTLVALDGTYQSNLVAYDITNGLEFSTPIGSQIETPLALINNDLHIGAAGEIFVVGSYQGENRFLTYNNVRSDLEGGNNYLQGYSLFMSKFESIYSKVENLNANLATFGQSGFSIIGSATNEVQMYLGSADGTTSEYYQYLNQGEIYFSNNGVVYGYDGTVDNQVLYPLNSGGQGINIDEAGIYYISVNSTNGEFILEKIPDLIMSEYEPIKFVSNISTEQEFNIFSEINEENNSLTITYPSVGLSLGVDGNAVQDLPPDTYDQPYSLISEISLTDYQILWEKAGPPVLYLSGCELISSTEGIFYLHYNGGDLDPRADSEDIVDSSFQKISGYTLDGEYGSSFAYNPRINTFYYYDVHNLISSDGSKYFVGHNRAGLDFNNDNNLDIDASPVGSRSFYIRKYNSANELMWMKSIENLSDINPTNVSIYATAEDSQNNLLLYGKYYGDLYFDSSSSNGLLSNPTTTFRYFMAKYSPNGDLIWAKDWVNDTTQDFGSIASRHKFIFDNDDNMYFLATLYSNENADPIDIDPRDESAYYINFDEANTWHTAIIKFDSDLNIIYGKLMDSKIGPGRIFSGLDNGIAVNNEVLQYQYVTLGNFNWGSEEGAYLIDVDTSEENEILVESYGKEVLVNYNLDGEYISHHVLVSELNDPELPYHTRISRPSVDEEGNIYTKTIYYYPLADGGYTRPMIIRKYNPNYELQWQKAVSNNDLNIAVQHPVELQSSGLIFIMNSYRNYLDLADFNFDKIYADTENSSGTAIIALSSDNGELVYLKNYPNNTTRVDFSVSDEELLVSGNYTNQLELDFDSNAVNYTAYNGSSEQFYASYLFSETLGVDSNISEINWTVYPNPTSDTITIQINSFDFCELYNTLGQKILVSKSRDISLSDLKAGLYFVKVFDKSGSEFTKKIIKK
jgi:hypothetical protein